VDLREQALNCGRSHRPRQFGPMTPDFERAIVVISAVAKIARRSYAVIGETFCFDFHLDRRRNMMMVA
jgi:hypothetical protein